MLVIVALLTVLPVVLPPIFGYHTYLSGTDHTGNISKNGSVVYLKTIDEASYKDGNIVAIESADSSGRRVDSYYVDSNDSSAKEIALRDGNGVSYKVVKGQVIAKTPFIGYLSQLCFSAVGIIVTVVIFAAGVAIMMYVNKSARKSTPWLNSRLHSVSEFPSATLENLTIIKQTLCLRNRISDG